MKQLRTFLRNYTLFAVTLLAAAIALGLQLGGEAVTAHWLLGIVAIVAVLFLLRDMLQDLRHGRYGIDILAATAIIASVILGEYWAGMVVVLMLSGGKSLEDYAERRAQGELQALLEHAPRQATVIRKGKPVTVSADAVRTGDKIIIKAGEMVPADAAVIEGTAQFDESSLTGESLPRLKQVGDILLSGSVNGDGPVTAKVVSDPADSQYQQIIRLVRNAAASRAPFVRLADRYSLPFTFAAFALGGAVWALSGEAIRFLEVIIVATPCPLLLAVPIALMSGMTRASRYGIIVKTGSALERLAEIETIAFDKTGTLTQGTLSIGTVRAFGAFDKDEILRLAASLEQNSGHVIAGSIVAEAQTRGLKLPKVKNVQEQAGLGLAGTLKGKRILVGRSELLVNHGIDLPASRQVNGKTTAVYVAVNGQLAGSISLSDQLRPEAAGTIARLRKLGVTHLAIITGDNKATAQAVAGELAIDTVYAGMLPGDKLHTLSTLPHRPAAFIGDGINDAPVLTAADVGIALGARGSAAAADSADVVVLPDDLSRVAGGVEIAKRAFAIARQSIFIGIGLSLVLMAVFATGKFTPLLGAVLQEVVDVIVIFYALRAHRIEVSDVH